MKSVNCLLDTCKNLDCDVLVSKSLARSNILIASTLSGSLTTSKVMLLIVVVPYEILDSVVDSITVSAKFFNPAGCTNLPTGSTILSHSIELSTVYDKFWK